MTTQTPVLMADLTAANDAPGLDRRTVALRDLTVLLARAYVRDIARRAPANQANAPMSGPRGDGQ